MRPLLIVALLSIATSADAAKAWTCSDVEVVDDTMHFEISPPDVIMAAVVPQGEPMRFHIVRNDDHGPVATGDEETKDALEV